LKDLDSAEIYLREAQIKGQESAELHFYIGEIYYKKKKYHKAITAYKKCLKIEPHYEEALINAAISFGELGHVTSAIKLLKSAVLIQPKNERSFYNLAYYFTVCGNLTEAKKHYKRALKLAPNNGKINYSIVKLSKFKKKNSHLINMENILKDEIISADDATYLEFSLGKAYQDLEEFELSYMHYFNGNKKKCETLNYNFDEEKKNFKNISMYYEAWDNTKDNKTGFSAANIPIFIVGMPRSGSTLVENIISSHSQVAEAGELSTLSKLGDIMIEQNLSISNSQLKMHRDIYLKDLNSFSNEKPCYITDKLPQNFRHIPLIKFLFPDSKIIHIRRDARATCWSIFSNIFAGSSQPFSYNLESIVQYFLLYQEIMKTWQEKYPESIYNLNYEDLVLDPEHEISCLLNFIGLEWQEKCLTPHLNKRSVKTASNHQIRDKIYKGSSENWKKFKPYIDGAFDGLSKY
jgi:tetratricopeptide (TPR) repeat protein